MTTPSPYTVEQPARADIDALKGAAVLDFGTNWCGFCKGASPKVEEALAAHGSPLQHIKVEDGSGRPLGRSFGVKLWPTLVVLQDGREVARVVRPTQAAEVAKALAALAPAAPSPG